MLHKHGLEDKRDYTMVEAPFPTMKAMLKEKKAAWFRRILPFPFDPEMQQIARPLFPSRDAIGITQLIVWTANKPSSTRTAPRWSISWKTRCASRAGSSIPKNHEEVDADRREITKLPPERFFWLFTKQDYHHSLDMLPNLDALQSNINLTHDSASSNRRSTFRKYTDLSLAKEAAARLK